MISRPTYPGVLLAFACALALYPHDVVAQEGNWITNGKLLLDARLRFEQVDDEALSSNADALTLRTRLGWQTASANGWYVVAEVEDVTSLIDDYNSTANGETRFPVVVDPEDREWNQAFLGWGDADGNQFALGRQRLKFDNTRFIGNVGWRQNEQTFDALSLSWKLNPKLNLRYAYLNQAHRIFGNNHPNQLAAEQDLSTHLINLAWSLPMGSLVGYGYFHENQDLPLSSTQTLGLRLSGKRPMGESDSWFYAAEYASQTDYADAIDAGSVDYLLLEGGVKFSGHALRLGFESLGSNGRRSLQTPLATLHAFNGWVDRFLSTPADGLNDFYVGVDGPLGPLRYAARWHQYDADRGSADFGQELDMQIIWPFHPKWKALAKYAVYDADDFSTDVSKFWLSVEYKF